MAARLNKGNCCLGQASACLTGRINATTLVIILSQNRQGGDPFSIISFFYKSYGGRGGMQGLGKNCKWHGSPVLLLSVILYLSNVTILLFILEYTVRTQVKGLYI